LRISFEIDREGSFIDVFVGLFFSLISIFIFVYYTTWVFFLPFYDDNHPIQKYFLSIEYAQTIPFLLLALGIFAMSAFFGFIILKNQLKKKKD